MLGVEDSGVRASHCLAMDVGLQLENRPLRSSTSDWRFRQMP